MPHSQGDEAQYWISRRDTRLSFKLKTINNIISLLSLSIRSSRFFKICAIAYYTIIMVITMSMTYRIIIIANGLNYRYFKSIYYTHYGNYTMIRFRDFSIFCLNSLVLPQCIVVCVTLAIYYINMTP